MNLNLRGKVVIVTGGGAGIGRATVERFEAEGASVVTWDTTSDPPVDVTRAEQVESAVRDVVARHGRIDVLVNNAGILRDRALVHMTEEEWDTVTNVHLKGHFVPTRFAAA